MNRDGKVELSDTELRCTREVDTYPSGGSCFMALRSDMSLSCDGVAVLIADECRCSSQKGSGRHKVPENCCCCSE